MFFVNRVFFPNKEELTLTLVRCQNSIDMQEVDPIFDGLLACPVCKSPLAFGEESLNCVTCWCDYPVEEGIACLVQEKKKGVKLTNQQVV